MNYRLFIALGKILTNQIEVGLVGSDLIGSMTITMVSIRDGYAIRFTMYTFSRHIDSHM